MKTTRYYSHRDFCRVIVQAETPLAIGTGEKSILSDATVVTDVNGLPYIPGTSLAGVIRSQLISCLDIDTIFGFQEKDKGHGSFIVFSDAMMIGSDGKPVEGLLDSKDNDEFYSLFRELPIRQHVRINSKGTGEKNGKFDNVVVYKGCRFCFEMEFISDGSLSNDFSQVKNTLLHSTFRVGGNTRSGLGKLKVVRMQTASLDLNKQEDLEAFVNKSASLSSNWDRYEDVSTEVKKDDNYITYTLNLKPDDFFLFGSGMGDDEADITPVSETVIEWKEERPSVMTENILIPGSSVKGALAHRTAYYWNKNAKLYADDNKGLSCNENPAVQTLFGYVDSTGKKVERGHVFVDDLLLSKQNDKIFNHVAIDRFTGGSMDGALFTEKTTNGKKCDLTVNIAVERKALENEEVKKAFEMSLDDICNGILPLGGGVNRGHGIFSGTIKKEE